MGGLLWADGREWGLASQDKATMAGAIWSALAGELHQFQRSATRHGLTEGSPRTY